MLRIQTPRVIETAEGQRLVASFSADGQTRELWFGVPGRWTPYLTVERADAFFLALVAYATEAGHDVVVEAPVSERLYYLVTHLLLPTWLTANPGRRIKIECDLVPADDSECAGAVGAGISCGIDSLWTVAEHTAPTCPPHHLLTHLVYLNVGSHSTREDRQGRRLFEERQGGVRRFADEIFLPLVEIDSNVSDVLGLDFLRTHTQRSLAAVLALQKLFRIFYYSAGVPCWRPDPVGADVSADDTFAVRLCGTESLLPISAGESYTRFEKTRRIADYEPSHRHLNVCVRQAVNCGECFKCVRTLVTLDVLGHLDEFEAVFDLDAYRRVRNRRLARAIATRRTDRYMQEIWDEIVASGFKMPLLSRASAPLVAAKERAMAMARRLQKPVPGES